MVCDPEQNSQILIKCKQDYAEPGQDLVVEIKKPSMVNPAAIIKTGQVLNSTSEAIYSQNEWKWQTEGQWSRQE